MITMSNIVMNGINQRYGIHLLKGRKIIENNWPINILYMKPFLFEIFVLYILVWVHSPFKQEKRLIFSKFSLQNHLFYFWIFWLQGRNSSNWRNHHIPDYLYLSLLPLLNITVLVIPHNVFNSWIVLESYG